MYLRSLTKLMILSDGNLWLKNKGVNINITQIMFRVMNTNVRTQMVYLQYPNIIKVLKYSKIRKGVRNNAL